MMNWKVCTASAIALIAWSCGSVALAVPGATYTINLGTGEDYQSSSNPSGSLSSTSPTVSDGPIGGSTAGDPGEASASASITAGTDPNVTVSTTTSYVPDSSSYSATAIATLAYYFEVTGATGGADIDINGNYILNTETATSASSGPSSLELLLSGNVEYSVPLGFSSSAFSETDLVSTNAVWEIQLTARVDSLNANSPNSATIDPLISLDPVYLAEHPGATLEFSDGFAPSPEPASLALLGLGAMGLLGRRRRT